MHKLLKKAYICIIIWIFAISHTFARGNLDDIKSDCTETTNDKEAMDKKWRKGGGKIPRPIIASITGWIFSSSFASRDYHWDSRLQSCLVFITVDGKIVGTGFFITPSSVLTTASVAERHMNKPSKMIVYSLYGHGQSRGHAVKCIASIMGWKNYRTYHWVRQGFSYDHSPIHDLLVLGLHAYWFSDTKYQGNLLIALPFQVWDTLSEFKRHYPNWFLLLFDKKFEVNGELASINRFATDEEANYTELYGRNGWYYISAGCCEQDVFKNFSGNFQTKSDRIWVDCDEWIPREWGHFICIRADGDEALLSGAALFRDGYETIMGLSSFTVTRNDESIHAFTEIFYYTEHLYICSPWKSQFQSYLLDIIKKLVGWKNNIIRAIRKKMETEN